jgi:hypothetical protein
MIAWGMQIRGYFKMESQKRKTPMLPALERRTPTTVPEDRDRENVLKPSGHVI